MGLQTSRIDRYDSSFLDEYIRVSRGRRCVVCDKPDWCLIHKSGDHVLCQRVKSEKRFGNAGWLHSLSRPISRKRLHLQKLKKPKRTIEECEALNRSYLYHPQRLRRVEELAESIGVSWKVLLRFQVGWDGEAWTFPMRDHKGRVLGIRRRLHGGRKLSLQGSREGLFFPMYRESEKKWAMFICEGPTDAAALDHMDMNVIGRPNCHGGTKFLVARIKKMPIRRITVISDNDGPGVEGALSLYRTHLKLRCPATVVAPKQHKDLREFWVDVGSAAPLREAAWASRPNQFFDVIESNYGKGTVSARSKK